MQGQSIHLRLNRTNHFRMTMPKRKNSEATKTVDEFTPMNVPQETPLALPFDHRSLHDPGLRPTIQIGIKILDALPDDSVFLLVCRLVIDSDVHRFKVIRNGWRVGFLQAKVNSFAGGYRRLRTRRGCRLTNGLS